MTHLAPEPAARQGAILIVDDAPDSREGLRILMQEHGYQALVAGSGEQALEIALHAQPDLVLLELALPGIDGLETCRRLKANPATSHIPAMFLSASSETEHFDSFLDKEWQRATRSGAPLSLLMIDVDHFKLYNDTLGHAAGDICLQQLAAVLQQHALRASDLAARYGGEEFVVLFGDTPLEAAVTLAESIRAAVEALRLPNPRSPTEGWVTASIGVASMVPAPDGAPRDLLLMADRRLYAAKEAGRNRIAAQEKRGPCAVKVMSLT